MGRDSLDCVAQFVFEELSLVAYGLQGVLMGCDTITGLGEGITYALDQEDMDVMCGALETVSVARDRLNEVLQTI